jgi:hypothetical protein
MKNIFALIMTLMFSVSLASSAQNPDVAKGESNISPVRLLPGYKFRAGRSLDTGGGTIWKEGGLEIDFVAGAIGSEADSIDKKDVVWREQQVVNGQRMICVYTKSHDLVISFPKLRADFSSKIRSRQDLAEMLMMVVTFEPRGYPVEPGAVVTTPRR